MLRLQKRKKRGREVIDLDDSDSDCKAVPGGLVKHESTKDKPDSEDDLAWRVYRNGTPVSIVDGNGQPMAHGVIVDDEPSLFQKEDVDMNSMSLHFSTSM